MAKACTKCSGSGRMPCPTCGASGSIFLPGKGVIECPGCGGDRYVSCDGPGPH